MTDKKSKIGKTTAAKQRIANGDQGAALSDSKSEHLSEQAIKQRAIRRWEDEGGGIPEKDSNATSKQKDQA